ncbi:MAG: hypothetical protein ACP5N3_04810 [Candidatus Nanoarchaeia archaeon]
MKATLIKIKTTVSNYLPAKKAKPNYTLGDYTEIANKRKEISSWDYLD